MPELQPLTADHASAVLAFETANRAYFSASISDRGEEYFEHFAEGFEVLLADQAAGGGAYYVLVADDGEVLGRFNLIHVEDGVADLGCRLAQHASGRGLATTTVREVCSFAAVRHGLRTLRAATSSANVASQRVLLNAGFVPVGPADPADLGGKPGSWYQRDVVPPCAHPEPSGPGRTHVKDRRRPVPSCGPREDDRRRPTMSSTCRADGTNPFAHQREPGEDRAMSATDTFVAHRNLLFTVTLSR